jgi:hypothetical protein
MIMVTLFAMHVVSRIPTIRHYFILTTTGLYYKLHGRHRPQDMKKSNNEIKRRKRVIPASSAPHAPHAAASHTHQITLDHAEQYHAPHTPSTASHRLNGSSAPPLPVDFTNYHPPSPSNNTLPPINFPIHDSVVLGRKRSLDETHSPESNASNQRARLASLLESEPSRTNASAIDPSLGGAEDPDARKALEAHRERLRAELAMVEAQLSR